MERTRQKKKAMTKGQMHDKERQQQKRKEKNKREEK